MIMLLPDFTLSQTPNHLIIKIRTPYCSLGELECDVSEDCFIFACFPYYLRLMLPGSVKENSEESKYCSTKEEFEYTLEKKYPGEEFKDLDIYPKLLIGNQRPSGNRGLLIEDEEDSYSFGFAMKGNRRFTGVAEQFLDMFDINPTIVEFKSRRAIRMQMEQRKFNRFHYLLDFEDSDLEIADIIKLTRPWENLTRESLQYAPEIFDFMKQYPRLTTDALSPLEQAYAINSLIDILFAYCYDRRTTNFEGTCESAWTISKLAATLSCFDAFDTTKSALIAAFRRTLTFALFRNFFLAEMILEDLKSILRLGKKYIVKCLLNIHNIFLHSGRYILNTLYINDYIYYVHLNEDVCDKALCELEKVKMRKSDLGLNLNLFEDVYYECFSSSSSYSVASDDSDDSNAEFDSDWDSTSESESESEAGSLSSSIYVSSTEIESDSESD